MPDFKRRGAGGKGRRRSSPQC